ncbi:MAG: hypothetical protein AB8I08_11410 [Sandaracinaceae bacterium]
MTVRVHESRYGSGYMRVLEASLRVFPGVRVTGSNRSADEPGPSLDEVRHAAERIRDQLRVWTPFTFRERTGAERTFHYEFRFRVSSTEDPTPVNGWVSQVGAPTMEVPSERGRSVQSALMETRRQGCLNAAVLPTRLIGDPNSPRLQDDGTFVPRRRDILHQYLSAASNVMVVPLERVTAAGNQTAAHEMGHMFGLWHQSRGGSIMRGEMRTPRRLLEEDQEALHWSIETPRDGILWGVRVSGPLPLAAQRPMALVYR